MDDAAPLLVTWRFSARKIVKEKPAQVDLQPGEIEEIKGRANSGFREKRDRI